MHFSYLDKAANGEFLDLYLKIVFKKILLIKKSEMKPHSEHLVELSTPEIHVM